MRKNAFIIAVCVFNVLLALSGCGSSHRYDGKANADSDKVLTVSNSVDTADAPVIVNEESPIEAFPPIRFFYTYKDADWRLTGDHGGRRYSRIAEYKNGNLSSYCSKRALFDMTKQKNIYTEACEIVLANNYKMIQSEIGLDVLTEEAEWYVVCYNKDDTVELKCIYQEDCELYNTPSDERATQIYEKINNAIMKKSDLE